MPRAGAAQQWRLSSGGSPDLPHGLSQVLEVAVRSSWDLASAMGFLAIPVPPLLYSGCSETQQQPGRGWVPLAGKPGSSASCPKEEPPKRHRPPRTPCPAGRAA